MADFSLKSAIFRDFGPVQSTAASTALREDRRPNGGVANEHRQTQQRVSADKLARIAKPLLQEPQPATTELALAENLSKGCALPDNLNKLLDD